MFMQVFLYEDKYKIALKFPLSFSKLIHLLPVKIRDQRPNNNRRKTKKTKTYTKFCQDVMSIWDHRCAKCGAHQQDRRLTVHHFKSFAREPDFRLDPDAAAPLCRTSDGGGCHHDFHKKYGYIDFTPEDFFEFIRDD